MYHRDERQRLILASASPRRAALLARAGRAFDVVPANVDERRQPDEPARDYVDRLARRKAAAVAARHMDRVVIGADTAVVVDGAVLGKPRGAGDAARMLRRLSGRAHQVLTGVAVQRGERCVSAVESTVVHFAELDDAQIAWYVGTGEPSDKAGAYGLQGDGARFVTRIEGSRSNVVGLPLARLERLLADLGAIPRRTESGDLPG